MKTKENKNLYEQKCKQDLCKFHLNLFSGVTITKITFAARDDECENDDDREGDIYFLPESDGNIQSTKINLCKIHEWDVSSYLACSMDYKILSVSYTHLTLPTICSV